MKKNYIFTLLITLCLSSLSFGQTILKFQDFESGTDDWSYTVSPATYNISSDVWAIVTSLGGSVNGPQNEANFWGMRDLENSNGGTADEHTLTFSNVDITGKTGVEVSFYYNTDGFDGSDYLKVEVFYDDVSQGIEDLDKNTDAWTLYSKSVGDNVNNVKLTVIAKQNGGSDYAGVDNFNVKDGVAATCGFSFGESTAICDTFTGGVDTSDTYNISLPYTGGVSGLTLSANAGTLSGDDPATEPSGIILITGVTEGTDVSINVSGGICNETEVVDSPNNCVIPKTLPIYESFDQDLSSDLSAAPYWINSSASTDEIKVVASAISNPYSSAQFPDPINNMVKFDGAGSDSYTVFPETTSDVLYSSFIFSVTDITTVTKTGGGYFAILTTSDGGFALRLWLNPDTTDSTKFKIGVSSGSSATVYETGTHAAGESIFVVLAHDFTSDEVKVWINPDASTLGSAAAPASTLTDAGVTPANLGRFLIRQDSATETPEISLDELRISTNWADVAPKSATAYIANNAIAGFSTYPNPITNNTFTLTSASNEEKSVMIFNLLGKKVLDTRFSGTKSEINVAAINAGIYILKVMEAGKIATKKLVIR